MNELEEELEFLNNQLRAYAFMKQARELTIETANADIQVIDRHVEQVNARIKEIQNVQGSVSTVDSGSKGNSP